MLIIQKQATSQYSNEFENVLKLLTTIKANISSVRPTPTNEKKFLDELYPYDIVVLENTNYCTNEFQKQIPNDDCAQNNIYMCIQQGDYTEIVDRGDRHAYEWYIGYKLPNEKKYSIITQSEIFQGLSSGEFPITKNELKEKKHLVLAHLNEKRKFMSEAQEVKRNLGIEIVRIIDEAMNKINNEITGEKFNKLNDNDKISYIIKRLNRLVGKLNEWLVIPSKNGYQMNEPKHLLYKQYIDQITNVLRNWTNTLSDTIKTQSTLRDKQKQLMQSLSQTQAKEIGFFSRLQIMGASLFSCCGFMPADTLLNERGLTPYK